jgi:signal transduction histidine kinase
MTVLAGRQRARVASWSLPGLTMLIAVATLVMVGLDAAVMDTGRIVFYVLAVLAVTLYAWIGRLLTARLPGNAIGWLLSLIGLLLASSMFAEQYSLLGLATAPGSLPAVRQVGALSGLTADFAFIQVIFVVLLFPAGRLPSRRWRPVLWGVFVTLAGAAAQVLQKHTIIDGGLTNALQAAGVAFRAPAGVFPRSGWFSDLLAVIAVIAVITAVMSVVSVFVRRRGASAELRQQLAWLGYVGALTLGVLGLLVVAGLVAHGNNGPLGTLLWSILVLTPVVGIPVACGIAVLKYRLYDLDVVVRRTVVAGLVAAAFTAIYALVVVAAGAVTGRSGSSGLTFAAAALAAVAFQPLRAKAGLLADRLVYGRRATPYEVLSDFAGRIAGTFSSEDVLPQMARMIAEATGAERAEVWLQRSGREHLEAAWPAAPEGPPQENATQPDATQPDAAQPDATEPDGRIRAFAVEHRGERLGSLRVTCSLREPLTPAGDRLVRDVAAQAGLVLRNVALIEDLRSSRQRLVSAADEARRGIERNLHDGAQQQLVALRITLGLARQVVASSPAEAAELLAETERQAEDAVRELRELAHGIYPPLLAELGLRAALEAHARRAALPVMVQAPGLGRYSQDVEAALYFCVLEALQNIAKYAQATTAHVLVCQDGQSLTITVEDDGIGFDQASRPMGSGLQGMSDRLAALGGTVEIASTPGHGTRLTGRVPALAQSGRPVPVTPLLPAATVLQAATVLPAAPVY